MLQKEVKRMGPPYSDCTFEGKAANYIYQEEYTSEVCPLCII
jgi:hypothetical protein